jgi:hypothetical protein
MNLSQNRPHLKVSYPTLTLKSTTGPLHHTAQHRPVKATAFLEEGSVLWARFGNPKLASVATSSLDADFTHWIFTQEMLHTSVALQIPYIHFSLLSINKRYSPYQDVGVVNYNFPDGGTARMSQVGVGMVNR